MRLAHLEWLYPGLGIKRWIVLTLVSTALLLYSVGVLIGAIVSPQLVRALGLSSLQGRVWAEIMLVVVGVSGGAVGIWLGARGIMRFERRTPDTVGEIRAIGRLARGPRIVAIGGGNGLAALLSGLKHHTSNLTAVVTMADDGGSSGLLRRDMGVPPPGDIRNCLVALADDESLMKDLFRYRFSEGGLKGHSFGNLFVAALAEVTGDFDRAVRESTSVLKVRGRVLPSTLENVVLHAQLRDGGEVSGESTITAAEHLPQRVWLTPEAPRPLPEAIMAVEQANLVVLGPGSVFTSIIPNLLIAELRAALARTRAWVVYVCNVMTQPGETDGFTASDHVAALYRHGARGLIDYVVVNDAPVPEEVAASYERAGARPVIADDEHLASLGVRVVRAPVAGGSDVFRHEPARLAEALMRIARR